jgi:hypothetical protein
MRAEPGLMSKYLTIASRVSTEMWLSLVKIAVNSGQPWFLAMAVAPSPALVLLRSGSLSDKRRFSFA